MTSQQRKGHRHRRKRKPTSRGPRREHIEELHPTEEVPEIEAFTEWDLGEELQRGIAAMDITRPTPIQALAIGPVLEGRDVIAKAETGTGKTLAFGAPMISRIDPARSTVLGLVLCPTRELAQQVCDVLQALALPRGVRVALVVGGDPTHPQIKALQAGAQVVVGTPGRVLDLAGQRFLSFPWTEYVVLDEADKMFEIGFLDDIKKILAMTPEERQTLLFSATFPTEVLKLARESTRDPLEVATARGTATVSAIDQRFLELDEADRPLALVRMLEQSGDGDVFLVFCERRTDVDKLMRRLERLPFQVKALHGGYDQASRFRVMSAFRTGEVKALVATDVASRGLDVQHVTHVVNYSVPREAESYTHRIGRTGRAGRTGTAITIVVPADRRRWHDLQRHTKFEIDPYETPGRSRGRGEERSRSRGRDRDQDRDRDRDRNRDRDRDRGRGRERGRDDDREPRRRRGRGDARQERTEGRSRSAASQRKLSPEKERENERLEAGSTRRRSFKAETRESGEPLRTPERGSEGRRRSPERDGDERPRRRSTRGRKRDEEPAADTREDRPASSDERRRTRRSEEGDSPRRRSRGAEASEKRQADRPRRGSRDGAENEADSRPKRRGDSSRPPRDRQETPGRSPARRESSTPSSPPGFGEGL